MTVLQYYDIKDNYNSAVLDDTKDNYDSTVLNDIKDNYDSTIISKTFMTVRY